MDARRGVLDGKTALVTGGSSGIGLATATLFAAEGARVVIVGRDEARLQRAAAGIGAGARYIAADLAHASGTRSVAEALAARGTMLDVLLANAGASNAPELFETTEADFDATVDVNFKSTFFTTHCFERLNAGASVILTCSVGYQRGLLGDPLYAAAKAAVRSLGRGLAAQPEFLERSIRVNVLSFGAVTTPMTGGGDPAMADALRLMRYASGRRSVSLCGAGAHPRRPPRRRSSWPAMLHAT